MIVNPLFFSLCPPSCFGVTCHHHQVDPPRPVCVEGSACLVAVGPIAAAHPSPTLDSSLLLKHVRLPAEPSGQGEDRARQGNLHCTTAPDQTHIALPCLGGSVARASVTAFWLFARVHSSPPVHGSKMPELVGVHTRPGGIHSSRSSALPTSPACHAMASPSIPPSLIQT